MAASARTPYLTIRTPKDSEKLELSAQSVWTFGRGSKNSVRIDDPFASRYHAKLQVNQSQHCYFVDLDSRNGTLLNDAPLLTPMWLKHGDRISIGETTISFEDGREPTLESALATSSLSILMVQDSVAQGEIWQEIFKTLNVSMVWEQSSVTLRQTLEERAISDSLPKVLLIDVSAYTNAYHFCRWCRQAFPQIQIFLMDSVRKEISNIERQIALKQGVVNFFPAMNRHNLVLKSIDRLRDINEVLSALEDRSLSQNELLSILKKMTLHHRER
jgi:pSer/pThr/pTyr-binding forkhead associated (FHA) protein